MDPQRCVGAAASYQTALRDRTARVVSTGRRNPFPALARTGYDFNWYDLFSMCNKKLHISLDTQDFGRKVCEIAGNRTNGTRS